MTDICKKNCEKKDVISIVTVTILFVFSISYIIFKRKTKIIQGKPEIDITEDDFETFTFDNTYKPRVVL